MHILRATRRELLSPLVELPFYLGLGAFSGLVAAAYRLTCAAFARALDGAPADEGGGAAGGGAIDGADGGAAPRAPSLARALGDAPWARPVVGGLACGALSLVSPQILFNGYASVNRILSGGDALPLEALLALLVLKVCRRVISPSTTAIATL
jgi:H+/Cl- antiporter ClcA